MEGKKFATMSGSLLFPLCVGNRAIIFHDGVCTPTSAVVAIHSVVPGDIRFETKNTHYRLLLNPMSEAAEPCLYPSMAAYTREQKDLPMDQAATEVGVAIENVFWHTE